MGFMKYMVTEVVILMFAHTSQDIESPQDPRKYLQSEIDRMGIEKRLQFLEAFEAMEKV